MYSVLIQNHKTMESFSKFHALFLEILNENRLGVCKWTEGGTTLDTAVPGLTELTNDKKEWQAVIVQFEDDSEMMQLTHTAENPFDFPLHEAADKVVESEVPIIRLTHMLGGVPELPVKFESINTVDKNGRSSVRFRRTETNYDMEQHELLKKKYEYDGNPPSSIILISVRKKLDKTDLQKAWDLNRESRSSDFWLRNRYPGMCRFMIFDEDNNGPIRKDASDFRFWLSVLNIVSVEPPFSTIQPYKLYRFDVSLNEESMQKSLQHSADRLRVLSEKIKKNIKKKIENPTDIDPELPDYKMKAAVNAVLPEEEAFKAAGATFGIFSTGQPEEVSLWEKKRQDGERELLRSLKLTKRSLDQSADRIKKTIDFDENDAAVNVLDPYQMEDLSSEINEIFLQVIRMQAKMPKVDSVSSDGEINDSYESIAAYLQERVQSKPFFIFNLIAFLMLLTACAPGIIDLAANGNGSWLVLILTLVLGELTILLSSTSALLIRKLHLNKMLRKYNQLIEMLFDKLVSNTDDYSVFLSDIVTHMRGCSFITQSNKKSNSMDQNLVQQYEHLKTIEKLLLTIQKWNRAFDLHLDFKVPVEVLKDKSAVEADSDENVFGTFESGNQYEVEINHSGSYIKSPFDFADRLIIKREEIYNEY